MSAVPTNGAVDATPSPRANTASTASAVSTAPASGDSVPRGGYLHIGPDWRITFAHLEGGRATDSTGATLVGRVLWDIYPELLGSPFEAHYRAAMQDRQPRTFEADYGQGHGAIRLQNRLYPAGDGIALVYEDLSARRTAERQLARRNQQQEAVARLGHAALEGLDVPSLLDVAVREVATALDVEFAKFVEPQGEGETLLLRAGTGWKPGRIGTATMPAGPSSQAGFAFAAHGPVVVRDLPNDPRFDAPPFLLEHGVVSGLSVLVGPRAEPFGVLGAHTATLREFTQDDVNFVQAVANLLGAAIGRNRIEADLRRHRDDLERSVQERTRLLEASNRELEAFSYSVSHDLRTPLRAIDGFSKLLLQQYGPSLPAPAQAMLDSVRNAAQRMGHLIESLLALSRIGRRTLATETVDLSQMATLVLQELAARDPGRKVTWTVEPGLTAAADPELMHILLDNLLGNAWKFSAHKGRARIEFGREKESDAFFVRDNGAGFDLGHAGRLFEPFQRLHSTSEFEGTGVGLATVQRIVQRHGGRVWAEAAPGKGATFRFHLGAGPAAPASSALA